MCFGISGVFAVHNLSEASNRSALNTFSVWLLCLWKCSRYPPLDWGPRNMWFFNYTIGNGTSTPRRPKTFGAPSSASCIQHCRIELINRFGRTPDCFPAIQCNMRNVTLEVEATVLHGLAFSRLCLTQKTEYLPMFCDAGGGRPT